MVAKWRWIILVRIPAAAWGASVKFTDRVCPLTDWENGQGVGDGEAGQDACSPAIGAFWKPDQSRPGSKYRLD